MKPDFDAIIIGGGPAGATAATFLAREGRSVLVLEREKFPRFHVGESLLPYNREIFEELGVWQEMEAAGFVRKRAAQFSTGSGRPRARLVFGNGTFTEHPEAFQVERARFDEILLRHAERAGAAVREETLVLAHQIEPDRAKVSVRDRSGAESTVSGRFLLDASGIAAFTGKREGIHHVLEGHRKVALFGHFDDVGMPRGDEEGDIVLVVGENSWCWMIPLSKTRTSVGIVVEQAAFAAAKQTPEALFESIVQGTPELRRRMAGARRETAIHVISDYSCRLERMVSPRLIRIGDAAGFLDPIFSSGVLLAMQLGRDGARCVLEALSREAAFVPSMHRYEKDARAIMGRFWEFIKGYYTRPFRDLFLQPAPNLQLPSAINAVLAGRPDMPWAVRWRLWVFFGLVRLQRHLPVARRVNWSLAMPASAAPSG